MAGGKFEVGKGEALYYRALAQLALSPMEADDVAVRASLGSCIALARWLRPLGRGAARGASC